MPVHTHMRILKPLSQTCSYAYTCTLGRQQCHQLILFLKSIVTGDFKIEGPEWSWVSEYITTQDKALMRQHLLDIFYGKANVDVLLQWIKKKG